MLIGVIVGALAWQLVTVFAYLLSNQNEDTTMIWGMGIWRLISYYGSMPFYYFGKWLDEKNYVAMLIDTNGTPCYCESKEQPELLINIDYQWNRAIREKYTQKDGWKRDHCICGEINLRYTPIKIAKAEGAYKVDKAIIKEAEQRLVNKIAIQKWG